MKYFHLCLLTLFSSISSANETTYTLDKILTNTETGGYYTVSLNRSSTGLNVNILSDFSHEVIKLRTRLLLNGGLTESFLIARDINGDSTEEVIVVLGGGTGTALEIFVIHMSSGHETVRSRGVRRPRLFKDDGTTYLPSIKNISFIDDETGNGVEEIVLYFQRDPQDTSETLPLFKMDLYARRLSLL